MYLVAIAWLYVAVMMTVAEATHPTGTLLGAAITFVLYGALPVALVLYILNTPHRRRARKAQELAEASAAIPVAQATATVPASTGTPSTEATQEADTQHAGMPSAQPGLTGTKLNNTAPTNVAPKGTTPPETPPHHSG